MLPSKGQGPLPFGLCLWLCIFMPGLKGSAGCASEERLFHKLFSQYNQFIRPVENVSDPVMVHFEVAITQLANVDEVNQIMETNLWLRHIWNDYKLRWDPMEYDGIETLRVPADKIWKPDIVLYNNAVGDFQVEGKTKALLKYDGMITWTPPAIFKSSCPMDITFFPFDHQNCSLKFGSWTYDKAEIDLLIIGSKVDMKDFWENSEWEIVDASGYKHDIKYNCLTVFVLNIHYRTPTTHTMPKWVKTVFLQLLPQILMRRRPLDKTRGTSSDKNYKSISSRRTRVNFDHCGETKLPKARCSCHTSSELAASESRSSHRPSQWTTDNSEHSPDVEDVINSVQFIAANMKNQNETKEVEDDWKYVAMVVDRVFLWVFIIVCVFGTAGLFLQPLLGSTGKS
ncbi:neuronal acetylcholine receptor subunit alpha-6 isoform X3 [Ursus arctos]|uniref:neuronal acetylcholine receptor subunit alpha-6 isoform X3 n=1 Tax=Ursus arctos TaxID=9644 RepID=UPI002017CDC4|nr:neuronal acetylcholine receptor subunit alpha-6 isoform X3 [Ursus arctos]